MGNGTSKLHHKGKKIELPLETWTEVFGFVPRSQLIQLVPHIGETHKTIGDRAFVTYVQFFLHECGEVTLGQLHIKLSENGNVPIVIVNENDHMPLALADVPIPENVKNFKSIRISNYDPPVIAFLQEFQRNSLLTNVNMRFHYGCRDSLLQIMTNFLPIFTNISSIAPCCVLDQIQSEHAELAMPMLTNTRVLLTTYDKRDNWFCDWLHIPKEDGQPRVLLLLGDRDSFSNSHFIRHVKKDFLEANQAASSFFIQLMFFRDDDSVRSLTLENGTTREKLVIKEKSRSHDSVTISRCPIGTNEEEWEEMGVDSYQSIRKRIIRFA